MNAIKQVVEDEPALVFGSLGTIIGGVFEFAAAYGLTMPASAHDALAIIGGGVVALVTLVLIRSKVTPVANLPAPSPSFAAPKAP